MSGAEAALRAARLGDEVVHGFGLLGMVAGALIGAAVAAVIVAAGVATGGLALVAIVGGCIAGGGLAGGALARGIMKAADLPGPTTGMLAAAPLPSRVTVNGRMALRAGTDFISSCSGMPMNHPPLPMQILIAEGAQKVTVNGKPMARQSMKMVCGAQIKGGSDNVTVGGPTERVVMVIDTEEIVETGLQVLGFVALGAGAAAAAAAGWAAAGLLGAAGGGTLFGAVTAGSMVGMDALHSWGESLGPGYGDIMVGVAGFALMGLGAKLSTRGKTYPHASDEAPLTNEVSIFGFRGAGRVEALQGENPPHPYKITGHVGYSLDGGKTIYGFGPNVPKNMSAFEAVNSLKAGNRYPGMVTDDTPVFLDVVKNPGVGRDGAPQAVYRQRIPVSADEMAAIRARHEAVGLKNPMEDVQYGFPKPGEQGCVYNCATYPQHIGIKVPERTGNLRDYMPELQKVGEPWGGDP